MWTMVKNGSTAVIENETSSKMVDPVVGEQLLHTAQHRPVQVSTAATTRPSYTEESSARSSGIIPGAIAAAVFIALLLGLYAVLWKCMTSSQQRKHKKVRIRVQQKASV
ncbi:uncharacterized protein sb:cb288 [Cololabis saira]|uniref:uncharacterized protein sb:cb288 n=1 Tax=Cololabis saira TaxID=129043 RepID=UPI002AD4EE55|nr:uncharacterized protein sb:cb288 [Cololabis saira]